MPSDQEDKKFTKEELDLVKDAPEDSGSEGADEKGASGDDAAPDATDDGASKEKADTSGDGASGDGSIFDDLDDDSDDDSEKTAEKKDEPDKSKDKDDKKKDKKEKEKPEDDKSSDEDDKASDKDDKPADEKNKDDGKKGDWREGFIEKALKKQKGKLTAEKFEKRKEALKRELSRYSTPEDYMIAGLSAREKLRSGEYRRAKLPDDATDEEVASWRKDNNIPEEPKSYDIPKIAGHMWTDADVPFIDSFKEAAHSANMSQEQMDAATKWYAATLVEQQNEYAEEIAAIDKEDRSTVRDTLRAELGAAEYKTSLVLMERLIKDDDALPGEVGSILLNARYTDDEGRSRRLINNADLVRYLVDVARDTYGDVAIVSGDGVANANNRKKEIEDLMTSDIKEYFRRGWDKEYGEITQKEEARARRRGRAQA